MFGLLGSWGRRRPNRLKKLAENVDRVVERDAARVRETERIDRVRREAAIELHAICFQFVTDLNGLLTRAQVVLDPPEYNADSFSEERPNLFQVNVNGRILQIEFEAPESLISTEYFRDPYLLSGSVRGFNQEMLERALIEEQLIFFCANGRRTYWKYFDARTYHSGEVNADYLGSLLQNLV